jgi:glycosyltransferase involved in cell wall biosynthesis
VFSWSLKKAKQVIVQNEIDKENLQRLMDVASIVIRNGQRLVKLGNRKRDTVLWVGRSSHLKRPELFITLAQSTPDEKFTMVCQEATGDENYEQLRAKAKDVDNLQFIEAVPFEQINDYFQQAKVFVNTSESEGFPNTFVQACNCATPILSLKVNPDDFINKHNCGISCDGDRRRMTDALKVMLTENYHIKLAESTRKYAEDHHDIKKIVETYKSLFSKLQKPDK